MRLHTFSLLPICFLFLSASLVSPAKSYKYKSDEGKMSINFPANFEVSEEVKESFKTVKASASDGEQTFFASYTLHNAKMEDRQELSEVSLNSFAETTGGTITEKSDWNYKGNKGYKATINLESQNAIIEYQVIIIGNIQYQVIVAAPASGFDQKAVKKFMKSFKAKK